MRIILILALFLAGFALLLQAVPTSLHLPLYCLFLGVGLGYVFWVRRQIQQRQAALEEEYRAQRHEWETVAWGEEE